MIKLLSTKGRNLAILKEVVKSAKIADLVLFSVLDWKHLKKEIINKICMLRADKLIVRSSCLLEDQDSGSLAGVFSSYLNVEPKDVGHMIDACIASYGRVCDDDEVLVQPMLKDVILSGVAFSHDPYTCSEYRVISWHDSSDTTRVTSGQHANTVYELPKVPNYVAQQLDPLRLLMDELCDLYGGIPIECEFAFSYGKKQEIQVWLLQVRSLLLSNEPFPATTIFSSLGNLKDKLDVRFKDHPYLLGDYTVYAVMPDWNPAEIIGIRPKQLALTLYRELITDNIWAYQRHNYGYRNLRSFPLMIDFAGLPYIDVRVSFNSFIPQDLPDSVALKLANFYLNKFVCQQHLHDKIEFEIVLSCYTLDMCSKSTELLSMGFSNSEVDLIFASLRRLTNNIINDRHSLISNDLSKLDILKDRLKLILTSSLDTVDKIYWLSEDLKRYGTLPFAGIARTGFIASQMLQSFNTLGIFDDGEIQDFWRSLHTVAGRLARDKAELSPREFIELYGHLRPGTYDIDSLRYDENPELYFDWSEPSSPPPLTSFRPSLNQLEQLDTYLSSNGIEVLSLDLLTFIKSSIELREEAKFIFTKTLSSILTLLVDLGRSIGISREDMAFLDFRTITEQYISLRDLEPTILNSIANGKKYYDITKHLNLPPIISSTVDLYSFISPANKPNFITRKKFIGKIATSLNHCDIEGHIVFIENADPGYDWLFSHQIGALITAWGGINSHMAIRAGELQIPAVIGSGEHQYNKWKNAYMLSIDCAGSRVDIIR